MTTNAITRQYGLLSPEERFRLILAASGRGDEAEHARLVGASDRIHLTMPDYSPYANALQDVTLLIYIELLTESSRYMESLALADQEDFSEPGERGEADDDDEPETADLDFANERRLRLALASGYVLRTKVEGWKQFCERWTVPPFLLWQELPGFDQLQGALRLTDQVAFTAEGFLRWVNNRRPASDPPLTEVPVTAAETADDFDELFRSRIEWWGGPKKV
ncbi:MAG TPA: hypothetical protein VKE40_04445 [Gemmataceae bacterium]|nr:hypothetical protein [Gemmataceae bacterium]